MKTAVSVPDEIFKQAERLAKRARMSRSRLFSEALREYVARHAPEEVTEAMDRVCGELGEAATDEFTVEAGRQILAHSEW
ncbi:Antitoxin MazE6 [Candidatus Methylomirabilis lanthanidiphila]|uniref:Antitoxin MazE6 n=1 Tax=Candidatus Methylomirabilis lanthanidiphila TaxID=2211376 RepID=A0A564ZG58_9BACT|nr:ribbon-helix-helix protein, CopG family [Candidatus Methylomirabilis lanthanidiphila]VUZ84274.1 Antitoxin MazE6 [Candidatus Methylomirabilis lanthanidiphila]